MTSKLVGFILTTIFSIFIVCAVREMFGFENAVLTALVIIMVEVTTIRTRTK